MASEYPVPTTEDLDAMFDELSNWGRWGDGDELGTLHFLTDGRRAAAAGLVSTGQAVSLAHDLATEPMPEHPHPVQHHMLASGDARDANGIEGYEAARDHLALDVHGLWTTHVDALSHMFVEGHMYGGRPASDVRSDGARSNTVLTMADGVTGRGVLLDVPRALEVEFLDSGAVVTVADLELTEVRQGVRVGPGDVLLVAWGREARRASTRGSTGSPDCTPSASRGWPNARWRSSAATASRTRCPSSAPPDGRSRSTRSASCPWASR